jgi:Flp pilus assembly protein TadD
VLGKVHLERHRFEDALESFQTSFQTSGGNTEPLSLKAVTLAKAGKVQQARDIVRLMEETAKARYGSAYNLAMAHNGLGEYDRAFTLLESAAEEKDVRMVFLAVDPKWNVLNRDARVRRLWPKPQQVLLDGAARG